MDIYTIIITISGISGVIFWIKDDSKKAMISLIILISSLLLKQMGI